MHTDSYAIQDVREEAKSGPRSDEKAILLVLPVCFLLSNTVVLNWNFLFGMEDKTLL